MEKQGEKIQHKTVTRILKYDGDIDACKTEEERREFLKKPHEVYEKEENCLLNTGIAEFEDLFIGAVSGASHIFDNAHATIGVGDSNTAADATQTDLQAETNKTYKAMDSTYPSRSSQTLTFQSTFDSADANYVWNEWVIKQSTSAICLNRHVDSMGTKASGSTWVLQVTITIS